jgi:4'-phosphopantetheinyl transferase
VNSSRPIECVLGRYLGLPPDSVAVARTSTGKPEVRNSPFRTNLAHGGEALLVAVTVDADIGVDVEPHRDGVETWSLVSHALTPGEQARLEALPGTFRGKAFLATWARKEALLKAVGVGLRVDPRLIELDGPAVVEVPPELGEAGGWTIVDVPVPDHASALAVRGPLSRLLLYDGT